MDPILIFLSLACLTFLFTNSEITFLFKLYFGVSNDDITENVFKHYIQILVNCSMCSGFWIFGIYYQDIYFAALGSITSELLTKFINR